MSSDGELLSAWRAGDRSAGNAVFQPHFDSIRRVFRNKVDHGVEDLVPRTFIACVESRDRFREQASFRTWLFAIAHNVLCDRPRRQRRTPAELDLDRLSVVDLGASPHSMLVAHGESTMRRLETDLRRLDSTVSNLEQWAERLRGRLATP